MKTTAGTVIFGGVRFTIAGILAVIIYSFMTPVFRAVLSVLMIPESSNVELLNLFIALVLVCSGIFLINYNKTKNQMK